MQLQADGGQKGHRQSSSTKLTMHKLVGYTLGLYMTRQESTYQNNLVVGNKILMFTAL